MRSVAPALALLVAVAVQATACAKKPADATPEGAVESFLHEIDDAPRDPSAAARAYALLAEAPRESLRLRAERARSITGQRATPETMLAPLWSPARFEIERVKSRPGADASHVLVDVYGVDPGAQHVTVPVVREGDRWRIVLAIPPPPPVDPPSP
jgi:hypothetical protein